LVKNFSGLRHFAGDIWHQVQDQILFWNVKRRGGTYTDFYAIKMDRKALKDGMEVSGRPKDKIFHLDFLREQGLVPSMHFLDFGCGAAASGFHRGGFCVAGSRSMIELSFATNAAFISHGPYKIPAAYSFPQDPVLQKVFGLS